MTYHPEPIVRVLRNDAVESIHYGSAAIVDADGQLLYRIGDPYLLTFLRSSAKPFQAVPVVESGAAREFGFTAAELAVMIGSHSGQEMHIGTVQSILDKIGLGPENLKCGVHPAIKDAVSSSSRSAERERTPLHHNCSGKHAGMLALAVFKNLSVDDYLSPSHPVQKLIKKTIAEICSYPENDMIMGIDGCSAPNYALPLYNMALGFARLVTPSSMPGDRASAVTAVSMAMMDHPEMVAGDGRFDTALISSPGEKIISKAGAEGLECFSLVDRRIGAALKVIDGNKRALFPAAVELIYMLGARKIDGILDGFRRPVLKNWRGLEVGYIEPRFEISEVDHE
jgi:L-asparaginase II